MPRHIQWLLLLQNGLIPYIFYCLLTGSQSSPLPLDVVVWAGFGSTAVVVTALLVARKGIRIAFGSGTVWCLLLSLAAGRYVPVYAVILFCIFVLLMFYRIHLLSREGDVGYQNRLALRMDCLGGIIALLSCAIFYGARSTLFGWVSMNLIAAVVLRCYTLWVAERFTTNTMGASEGTLGWMAVLGILAILFAPTLLYYGSEAFVLALGAVFSLPLFLIPKGWDPVKRVSDFLQSIRKTSPFFRQPPPHTRPLHGNMIPSIGIVLGIALIAVLAAILLILLSRRKPERHVQPLVPVVTERKWLWEVLLFLHTKDVVRLQVQSWLRREAAKGYPIKRHETLRAYVTRLKRDDGGGYVTKYVPNRLREEYEYVRYKGMRAKEDE